MKPKRLSSQARELPKKADDIVDNVKGMTSVGGIVKTFANHVVSEQERKYAAEDAAREAAEQTAQAAIVEAERAEKQAKRAAATARSARKAAKK